VVARLVNHLAYDLGGRAINEEIGTDSPDRPFKLGITRPRLLHQQTLIVWYHFAVQ
jgi:hypothetical protein